MIEFDDVAAATAAAVPITVVRVVVHGDHLIVQLVLMVVMVIVVMMVMVSGSGGGGGGPPPSYRQHNVGAVHAAVHSHVPVQVAGLREPEQAQLALVRFFARVYPQVFGER